MLSEKKFQNNFRQFHYFSPREREKHRRKMRLYIFSPRLPEEFREFFLFIYSICFSAPFNCVKICDNIISNTSLLLIIISTASFSSHSNYNNSTDLHIAVTTSQGLIIEYDRQGLKRLSSGESDERWEQSLSVSPRFSHIEEILLTFVIFSHWCRSFVYPSTGTSTGMRRWNRWDLWHFKLLELLIYAINSCRNWKSEERVGESSSSSQQDES